MQGSFPLGGDYRIFAFFTPFGGRPLVKQAELRVGTGPMGGMTPFGIGEPRADDEDKPISGRILKNVDGLRIALQSSTLRAGEGTNLTVVVRDAGGAAPKDLEPVLGAPAQMITVSADRQNATAPELLAGTGRGGAPFVFHATFPTPGLHTVWTQFGHGGKTITVPFVLRIDGKAKQEATSGKNNHAGS